MSTNNVMDSVASPVIRVLRREEGDDQIEVSVEFVTAEATCPRCGAVTNKVHDRRTQRKRDQAEELKPVWLLLEKRRFRCGNCDHVFTEQDPLCGPRRRSTERLREALRDAVTGNPVKHVARLQQVSRVAVYRAMHEETT